MSDANHGARRKSPWALFNEEACIKSEDRSAGCEYANIRKHTT